MSDPQTPPSFGVERLATVSRSQLVEQIVAQITERILDGQLPPGTPLRQEQLATELSVSRTPLREALRVLRSEGFVAENDGNGTLHVVSLSLEHTRDVYEVRAVLDGLAARLASLRASEDDLQRMEQLVTAIEEACRPFDLRRFVDVHAEFHLAVLRAARTMAQLGMETVVQMSSRMLYPQLNKNHERMTASAGEHRQILEAIAAREPEEAERRARRHIENAIAAWLRDGLLPEDQATASHGSPKAR
ncbi:MAG TPA: GntR family transcriptional regulator [Solirubrobacteraceae bacterium]|jgi:DNA-binding GntR family transcriptional regulator